MATGTEITGLWLYVALMAAGAILFVVWSRNPRGVPQSEYLVAAFIPIWSGLAYFTLITGQGIVEINGREVYLARYLDWIVTTPLLLLVLGWTAMHRLKNKRYTLIATLMAAQVIMIASGLLGELARPDGTGTIWFVIGCAALGVVFYMFWGPLYAIAAQQGPDLTRVYRIAATYLTVQWCLYPIIVYSGPSYAGIIAKPLETWLLVIVPFFSKVGFSFVDLTLLRGLKHQPAIDLPATDRPA